MQLKLQDKVIYITGGTGGIGVPVVELLREAGANVIVYDLDKDGDLVGNLDRTCAYLSKNTPDILVNMAGYNVFDYCENQDVKALIDLNMIVPIRLSQAVLKGMKKRGSGQIVNMGSMMALIPLPHFTGYVTAKAGLKGFTDALRRELGGSGVCVTYIAPRAVKTAMNSGAMGALNKKTGTNHDEPEKVAARIVKAICKKEREIRIGWPERFFAFMHANFPSFIDSGLQKNRRIGEKILSPHKSEKETKDEKISPIHRIAS